MNALKMNEIYGFAAALLLSAAFATPAQAELSSAMKAKVKENEARLVALSKNAVLVSAAKEANATGGIAGMTNAKWLQINDGDALVAAMTSSSAAQMLKKFETENPGVSKVLLRDAQANVVATSARPLLYNNKTKLPFMHGIKGKVWHAQEVKPDPTTQINGVHLTAPVKDGGKVIGVLHTSVVAD